jgi:crotonobetainyl-CoA:carnitine CoA-transferase CaiB-like acyl-CoA transferase
MQLGVAPGYRLYETSDGWLCVAALTDQHWRSMLGALGRDDLLPQQEKEVTDQLEAEFSKRTAAEAFAALDGAGVPCEISDEHFLEEVFDNPEMISRGLVVTQQHPHLGKYETVGTMVDFSETPGTIWGPPPLVGQHSREILREFGFDDDQIDGLIADKAVFETILAAR